LSIAGGDISGGFSTSNHVVTFGGNINADSKTLSIAGGTVSGGFSTSAHVVTFGGDINADGNTFSIAGGDISGGFSTSAHVVTFGGAINAAGRTLTLTNSVVEGAVSFAGGSSHSGTTTFTGGVYATSSLQFTSDRVFKKDILPLLDSLDVVKKLDGVSYLFRAAEYPGKNFEKDKQIGFIAQDVERVLPEVVRTHEDGHKSISYMSVIPVLVEAVKEQNDIIEEQESWIDGLHGSVEGLERDVMALVVAQRKVIDHQASKIEELEKEMNRRMEYFEQRLLLGREGREEEGLKPARSMAARWFGWGWGLMLVIVTATLIAGVGIGIASIRRNVRVPYERVP
jgi:hypothetical protein